MINFRSFILTLPVFSNQKYSLHEAMMNYVKVSLEDADMILLVVSLEDKYEPELFDRFQKIQTPILLVLNKIDLAKGSQIKDKADYWKQSIPSIKEVAAVSAKTGQNVETLLPKLLEQIPIHPPFFLKMNLQIARSASSLQRSYERKYS